MITDVVIVATIDEGAAITALNAWCAAEHDGQQINEISADGAGGHKVASVHLYAAAFNYLHLTEFLDAVRNVRWRLPHSVIVYVDDENYGTFVMSPARPGRWTPAEQEAQAGTGRRA